MNVNTAAALELEPQPLPRTARIITVASGKGGVGKTHIATNLALAWARAGQRVLLVDGDLGLANVNVLLGISPDRNASHLLDGKSDFSDVVTRYRDYFDILPAGSALTRLAELDVGGQVRLLDVLMAHGHAYDIIIVDAGAGIGSNVRLALSIADEVLVVMNPEATSLTDAYALVKVASLSQVRAPFGVVVNRVRQAEEAREMHGCLDSAARSFLGKHVEFFGYVYQDQSVERAMRNQDPFVRSAPDSPAARCVQALAKRLAA
ncbi:MAG: MinD/ParA family protein [Deltaproteobacteria bacterium]